jgi:predicted dehydrogenase
VFTLGIVGLGAMGAKMADAAKDNPDFVIRWAADVRPDILEEAKDRYPQVRFTTDP